MILLIYRYLNHEPEQQTYDFHALTSVINLVLSQYPSRVGVVIQRKNDRDSNKFFFPDFKSSIGGGIEVWKGFFSSVRPSFKALMVNVNVSNAAFYAEGNLYDRMLEWDRYSNGANMSDFVSGIRVKWKHSGYTKTAKKTARFNAKEFKFMYDEVGREVTCEEYFKISMCLAYIASNLKFTFRVVYFFYDRV